MKNNFLNGGIKSVFALCSLVTVAAANAGMGPPPSPPDINFAIAQLTEQELPVTIAPGHDLIQVSGVGNFGSNVGPGASESDDNYATLDVSSIFSAGFNFYGTSYAAVDQFTVSSNGFVMLDAGAGNPDNILSPYYLTGNDLNGAPVFLVHTGDMSTENQDTFDASPGGNSTGTNDVFYHLDSIDNVVTITYDDVGACCDPVASDQVTAAQLRFHHLGGGDFVVEHRYEQIGWATDASENNLLGWSDGAGVNYDNEFSAANYAMDSNIGHPGVYAWYFVNGEVVNHGRQDTVVSGAAAGTVVGPLVISNIYGASNSGPERSPRMLVIEEPVETSYSLLDDADGRFALSIVDGKPYIVVAAGDVLDFTVNPTHDITVQVTYGNNETFSKVLTIKVEEAGFFDELGEDVAAGGLNWLFLFAMAGLLMRRKVR